MKVIHISSNSNGYEIVTLLANKVSETNPLAVIEQNGTTYVTGGCILKNTKFIRNKLDAIPKNEQLKFVNSIRNTPYIKEFYSE